MKRTGMKIGLAFGILTVASLVEAASISINFHNGNELDSTGTAELGVAGFGISQNQWNSLVANNNASLSELKCVQSNGDTVTRSDMCVTVTGTRGHYYCSNLSSSDNLLHGYIDDNDSYKTPTVTVTGVPYDKYRVVVYHSTDTANMPFGYDLVNGFPFYGWNGHTFVGTDNWGDSGPKDSANSLEEGVNTLVTPVLPNNAEKTLTVTGHRVSDVARGCIAAIQIFDASDEDENLDNVTNRFGTILSTGEGSWQFPVDGGVADPSGFGGVIIGTNGISHVFTSADGYANTAISVLAAIPESTSGTLVALGVKGSNDVQAKYNGDGTFLLTYNGTAAGGTYTVTSRKVDVSGVHAYTLLYRSQNGTTLYQDGVAIATAPNIKWNGKGVVDSTDIGMKHGGGEVLSGLTVYAAYTHYWTTDVNGANNLFNTYDHSVFRDENASIAKKAEVFTHLAGYGDTEGLLALMPHRTSTYEYGAWHSPLDATLADGEYVDGLEITRGAVEQLLPGVVTNAACASVLAEIPANVSGVIANFSLVDGSSTHYAFAYANGDGTVSLGWEGGIKFATSTSLTDWSLPHVWTFVNDVSGLGRLYRDDTLVVEATGLKFNNHKFTSSATFGNTPNGKYPLAGMKVYAVHTDFGSSSAIFDKAEDNAASVFDTFDFMLALPEDATLEEKLAGFTLYSETGVAYEPPPAFDPETDEVADECVLRISEIMPKPTDAQNRGKLAGMDVNGLESGWVEVENTSDKWADLGDYRFIRVNRGKKTDPAGVGNFPTNCMVAPHSRAIFYTSERYSNSKEQEVSAFEHGTFDGKPMVMGAELHNILVWGDKVNPKKSPYVRLYYAPGGDSDKGTVVDTVVVPSDLPEGWSIIVGDAADDEGTRRWMCPTPTRGRANTATDGLKRIGPNVGPLYEKKGQKKTDFANEFATPVPPAVPGTDYTVTLPINAVMNPDGTFTPRAADQIQSLKFVYRKDLDDTTLVTNVIEMATKNTVENWGDQYTATIPASYFPAAGHLMQWKVLITDGEGVEWTSPSFNNPDDGYEWYGTIVEAPELESATLPTWHMFASGNHLTQMDKDKDNQNLSLVPNYARIAIYDSSTSNYYDYVRIDLRGHTSAGFSKKGHGLRFAKVHPLTMVDSVTGEKIEEIRKTSLISEFADPSYMRQMIAFWLWRKMGNLVPFDFPVRCNLNGEFYQLAFNSERFTDELIEDVYGLDKFGYSWKNVGTLKSGSGTTAGGIEKKTPDDEDEPNVTVLQNELRSKITAAQGVSSSPDGGDSGLDNAELTKFVVEKFDLPAWLNYLASARITQEMDDVWANVCAYYDNPDMKEGVRGKGTWMPLGYDFNLSFGQWYYSDVGGARSGLMSNQDWYKSHPFYGGNRVRCYSASSMSSTINKGNDGYEAVWQSAKFRRLYLRRLRTLMDQELKEPGTAADDTPFMAKMYELADLMRADAALDQNKWPNNNTDGNIDVWTTRPENMDAGIQDIWENYVEPRREHFYVTHSVTNTAKAIGYGSNLNAGIPEAQSPIATLAPNIYVSNLTALDAEQAEALGVEGQLYDTEVAVIRNDNSEAVDMSGWRLAFSVDFTFPAGTVCDANDSIYIVADRRAYIAAHEAELTDQVIVGNATFTGAGPIALYAADGTLVYQAIPQTNELKYLRLHSFYGNTLDGGDTGEWFTLTNISDSVTLDLADVTVCFLKQGDDHDTTDHCHVTLTNKKGKGDVKPLGSWTAQQADYSDKGWIKIQNNKQQITIYDRYGSVCQSLKVTQKNFDLAYGNGGYLVCDSTDATVAKDTQWHEALYELANDGNLSEPFAAESQEAADAFVSAAGVTLSDEDKAAGLEEQYLTVVAEPVEDQPGQYVAIVVPNPATVAEPAVGIGEEGASAAEEPVEMEEDEDGNKTVSVSISNAVIGLWYGYEVADELGNASKFTNDVNSFERAKGPTHTVKGSSRDKTKTSGFFRVKASAAKPPTE